MRGLGLGLRWRVVRRLTAGPHRCCLHVTGPGCTTTRVPSTRSTSTSVPIAMAVPSADSARHSSRWRRTIPVSWGPAGIGVRTMARCPLQRVAPSGPPPSPGPNRRPIGMSTASATAEPPTKQSQPTRTDAPQERDDRGDCRADRERHDEEGAGYRQLAEGEDDSRDEPDPLPGVGSVEVHESPDARVLGGWDSVARHVIIGFGEVRPSITKPRSADGDG